MKTTMSPDLPKSSVSPDNCQKPMFHKAISKRTDANRSFISLTDPMNGVKYQFERHQFLDILATMKTTYPMKSIF